MAYLTATFDEKQPMRERYVKYKNQPSRQTSFENIYSRWIMDQQPATDRSCVDVLHGEKAIHHVIIWLYHPRPGKIFTKTRHRL